MLEESVSQFVENWDCPFYHPRLVFLWRIVPPYICWHVWKERNNRIFREEEMPMEVVMGIMEELLKENLMIAKCKIPREEPTRKEYQIAERWGIHENFNHFDNSKKIKRQQTRWKPPTITQLKLNFDVVAREGIGAVGGVLQNGDGEALLVYFGKIGGGSNNMAKVMAVLRGLQLINDMQIKEITIKGDSQLIIDMAKGVCQPGWNIQNIIMDIRHIKTNSCLISAF